MFSLQSKIRIYIIFSIIIYITFVVSIFVIDMYAGGLIRSIGEGHKEIIDLLNKLSIFAIVISAFGLTLGTYIFVFTFTRGINKYKDIARRMSNLDAHGEFNVKIIEFPKEDEFGDIGSMFNGIIEKVSKFDDLKTQSIKTEKQKFEILAEKMKIPVLVIGIYKNEKTVKYYNKAFEDTFAKKEENISYDIKNVLLSALKIHEKKENINKIDAFNDDIQRFIDDEFVQAVDLAIACSKSTCIKKDVTSLSGKEKYRSDNIEIIPIRNDHQNTSDVLIIFEKMKKK